MSPETRERLMAWAEAMEAGELRPPADVHDREAWDRYWKKQMEVGALEQGFNDSMASDRRLASLLHQRGARKIPCAGTGLSTEPLVLALHGFDVTALDISDVPRAVFRHNMIGGHHRVSQLPGVKVQEDDTIVFPGIIDLEVCPAMHQSADFPPRGERSLSYVTGDLSDPGVCSGPFDVIIERRTVQLFPDAEQHEALDRLAARLGPRALFISHQHRGDWTPDQPRRHFASSWLETSGFVAESASNASSAARVARLYLTTG